MNGVRDLSLSHLDTKYAKIDNKNGIKMKNWVRNTWVAKKSTRSKSQHPEKSMVNAKSQRPKKVNCQSQLSVKKSTVGQRLTWQKSTVQRC